MPDRVTIKDVARLAGVSVATVSAVLNANKYVSPELQRSVNDAIEQLGYRPNLVARSLKLNQTNAIGLIFTNITSAIWPPLVRAVQQCNQANGFDTILSTTDENVEVERQALDTLLAKQVDGILIAPAAGGAPEHIREAARRVPVIAIDRLVPGIESVTTDNQQATWAATAHLAEHGRRRIGIIAIPAIGSNNAARLAGYRKALEEQGLFDPALIREVDPFGRDAFSLTEDLLRHEQVDALLTTSQSTSIAALRAVNELGRRIPDDLALFCYDDTPWMEAVRPALSTVRQPIEEMGRLASDLLFGRLRGAPVSSESHVLSCHLEFRDSCGCRRGAEPAAAAMPSPPGNADEVGRRGERLDIEATRL
jgi:LacI family transcriptional regulator, galactose operon repressor